MVDVRSLVLVVQFVHLVAEAEFGAVDRESAAAVVAAELVVEEGVEVDSGFGTKFGAASEFEVGVMLAPERGA